MICPDTSLLPKLEQFRPRQRSRSTIQAVEPSGRLKLNMAQGPAAMIAVPIIPTLRSVVVASPDYLASYPALTTPGDGLGHRCIGMRMGNGRLYRWRGSVIPARALSSPLTQGVIQRQSDRTSAFWI
jgi:hypothetical protein